jgi:S-adenosylmethionine decarboxylase
LISLSILQRSGIADLIPDAIFDDFLFDPCGYSVNGVRGKHYFTIHVTPQEPCSFASFETNILLDDYNELVKKVVNVFKPGHFSTTLFNNEPVESVPDA